MLQQKFNIRSAFINLGCPCDSEQTCAIEDVEIETEPETEFSNQTHSIGTAKHFETNSPRIRSAFVNLGCPCDSEQTCAIEDEDVSETHIIGKAKHFETNSPIDRILIDEFIPSIDINNKKIPFTGIQYINLTHKGPAKQFETNSHSASDNTNINTDIGEAYASSTMDTTSEPGGVGAGDATESGRMMQDAPEYSTILNTPDTHKWSPDGNVASGSGLKGMPESSRDVTITTTCPGNPDSCKVLASVESSRSSRGNPDSCKILKPNTISPGIDPTYLITVSVA